MRVWYWCSLVVMILLFGINILAAPAFDRPAPKHLPVHKTLYVDRNLSEDQLDMVVSAAWEWHAATNGGVILDVMRMPTTTLQNDAVIVVVLSPDFPNIVYLDTADPNGIHLGYFYGTSGIPYIGIVPSRISEKDFKTVLLHEMGHALGLRHNEGIEGIGTLMYRDISIGADYVTDKDLKSFCKLYHCDAATLHDQ